MKKINEIDFDLNYRDEQHSKEILRNDAIENIKELRNNKNTFNEKELDIFNIGNYTGQEEREGAISILKYIFEITEDELK